MNFVRGNNGKVYDKEGYMRNGEADQPYACWNCSSENLVINDAIDDAVCRDCGSLQDDNQEPGFIDNVDLWHAGYKVTFERRVFATRAPKQDPIVTTKNVVTGVSLRVAMLLAQDELLLASFLYGAGRESYQQDNFHLSSGWQMYYGIQAKQPYANTVSWRRTLSCTAEFPNGKTYQAKAYEAVVISAVLPVVARENFLVEVSVKQRRNERVSFVTDFVLIEKGQSTEVVVSSEMRRRMNADKTIESYTVVGLERCLEKAEVNNVSK